mmetsp:Transcript_39652/g.84751  ORF Transcript_39652/g.84751 Transcript_39652/m.84751 type:complete len:229 (-) Transcript_39652:506-1192(-)
MACVRPIKVRLGWRTTTSPMPTTLHPPRYPNLLLSSTSSSRTTIFHWPLGETATATATCWGALGIQLPMEVLDFFRGRRTPPEGSLGQIRARAQSQALRRSQCSGIARIKHPSMTTINIDIKIHTTTKSSSRRKIIPSIQAMISPTNTSSTKIISIITTNTLSSSTTVTSTKTTNIRTISLSRGTKTISNTSPMNTRGPTSSSGSSSKKRTRLRKSLGPTLAIAAVVS